MTLVSFAAAAAAAAAGENLINFTRVLKARLVGDFFVPDMFSGPDESE